MDTEEQEIFHSQNSQGNSSKYKAQVEEGKRAGIKEVIKEATREEETKNNKLQELVSRNNILLMKTKTLFPFDFFPDTFIIDMTKVNIISRIFWATEKITNINLKDIIDVSVETTLFMGTLIITYIPTIESVVTPLDPVVYKISLMKRRDALRAQRILKGILIARREGIEISKCSPDELKHVIS